MRLSQFVLLLAQEDSSKKGKIQVKRKEDGKPTWVSPKTLEDHPDRYEDPRGPQKEKQPPKSQEKARRKELVRKRQEEEEKKRQTEQQQEQEQEKEKKFIPPEISKERDTKELIEWYLYDFEGHERPEEPGKEEPEKGKKPRFSQDEIEKMPRPGPKGCEEGTIRKTFVNKGTGEKFVRCRPLTEEEQQGREKAMQFLEDDPFKDKPEFAKQWRKQTGRKWDWKKEKARMVQELEKKHGDDPWWEKVKLDYGLA